MTTLEAVVEAVCLSVAGVRVAKTPRDEAFLGPHGFVGDRHEAEFVRLRDGRVMPNGRQWSAVSTEEVEALCQEFGVPPFPHGALGENLRLGGVVLGQVPNGSVLEFASGARLRVAGQNDPCVNAARELALAYGAPIERDFIGRAMGRRGVVGSVLAPGIIRVGDVVTISVPDAVRRD